jgi:hypothetical protein
MQLARALNGGQGFLVRPQTLHGTSQKPRNLSSFASLSFFKNIFAPSTRGVRILLTQRKGRTPACGMAERFAFSRRSLCAAELTDGSDVRTPQRIFFLCSIL